MTSSAKNLAARLGDILDPSHRTVIPTGADGFRPYNRDGVELPGMTWLPLSLEAGKKLDVFMLRMEPGAQSYPHEHTEAEQFLVMDGSLTDCDGTVYRAGDFVRLEPGSTHHSHTEDGCLLLVILRERNRNLGEDGS